MTKKLIFIDVDGTLLDHRQQLPGSAREALTSAITAGHQLILCTGRCKPEIYPFLWDVGFQGLIGSNGAYGEINGEVIFNEHMPEKDVAEIAAWLELNGAACFWATDVAVHPLQNFLDLFRASDDGSHLLTGDWSAYLHQIKPYVRKGTPCTASKVTFFLPADSRTGLADVQEHFRERFCIVPGSLPKAHGEVGELTAWGMDKSVGVRNMVSRIGVPLENTVALGDSANDIEMLKTVGTGVAMGNATPLAKAAADWVTASINDDGLALAFEALGLLDSGQSISHSCTQNAG